MKKLLFISALLAAGGFAGAPLGAQEQGGTAMQEPSPPVTQESGPTPRSDPYQEPGDTSGPAAGGPVHPPTVVQKDNPNIPDVTPPGVSGPSGTAAGAPGIEGKRGTQAGKEWTPPAEIRRKPSS
jgi:hypothetical protein